LKKSFSYQFSSWTKNISRQETVDWAEQLQILNETAELITPRLTVAEIIAVIYKNVNQLLDAYQFCVGIYDGQEGRIHYKGMIEANRLLPDFSVDALDCNRLASWCIRNEKDIFMNDFDAEFIKYLPVKPQPMAGIQPGAALYTPLKLNDNVVGLIMVRTIHKHVYHPHHLYILKTVGNFVVRALELAKMSAGSSLPAVGKSKEWRWKCGEDIQAASGKTFMLLTEKEKEVLLLLIRGLPNKAIAEKLFVSASTIKTHTLHIYEKMDVANRSSAILKAIECGWVA
jgi:DNA-binding CsgD family transcriptional regulator/transcriptional regulator with GAF, ATPase, and Fis domain